MFIRGMENPKISTAHQYKRQDGDDGSKPIVCRHGFHIHRKKGFHYFDHFTFLIYGVMVCASVSTSAFLAW
tara:strand:+ start:5560 stop:5772 length:213 start_codon:yes stop_codon:yes gene_type:complete